MYTVVILNLLLFEWSEMDTQLVEICGHTLLFIFYLFIYLLPAIW